MLTVFFNAIKSAGKWQISLRERTLGETSVQRNKVVMAVEKLKVHFDSFRRNDARSANDLLPTEVACQVYRVPQKGFT